ncbi:MAG: FecR family protein [Caulobacteraceae bacterium]
MTRAAKSADVDAEAALWAVRLEAGDLSDAAGHDLEIWLERDVRHVGALVRAQAVWIDLDRVAALNAGVERTAGRGRERRRPRRFALWKAHRPSPSQWAAAAASLAVCMASIGLYDHFDGRIAANRGEVRRVALDDGSTVILDSASVVQVKFSGAERTVFLRRGEASFQVAHNKARPFVVHAGDLAVRAVGTNFAVSLQPDRVAVTVAEGVVEVKKIVGHAPAERRLVGRDEELVASAARPMKSSAIAEADLARELAWRDGMLIFSGQKIAQAAVEVNRYARRPVVIDDPDLEGDAFVGVFRLGDSRAFADSAAAAYNDEVVERDGGLHIVAR